jgi:hypothetical protein
MARRRQPIPARPVPIPIPIGIPIGPDGRRVLPSKILDARDRRAGRRVQHDAGRADAGLLDGHAQADLAVAARAAGARVDGVAHQAPQGRAAASCQGRWVLDSGGFTELQRHGAWTVPLGTCVDAVRRYATEIGGLEWAAPQD